MRKQNALGIELEAKNGMISRLESEKYRSDLEIAHLRRRLEIAEAVIEVLAMGERKKVGPYDR